KEVEGRAGVVMESRVLLRLAPRRVGEAQLVPRVADAHERVRAIEPAREADDESLAQAALDIDVAREVRLEEPDMSEKCGAALGARVAEDEGEGGLAGAESEAAAVGEAHGEGHPAAVGGFGEFLFDERSHRAPP